jgi:hypothetical protein
MRGHTVTPVELACISLRRRTATVVAITTSVTAPIRTATLGAPVADAKASVSLDFIATFTNAAFRPVRVASAVIV